jgi:hypothetical protein
MHVGPAAARLGLSFVFFLSFFVCMWRAELGTVASRPRASPSRRVVPTALRRSKNLFGHNVCRPGVTCGSRPIEFRFSGLTYDVIELGTHISSNKHPAPSNYSAAQKID